MKDEAAQIGHNSKAATPDELLSYAQRIERLTDEKKLAAKEYGDSIKEVWAEAKNRGYDAKALKEVIRIRAMDEDTRSTIGFYADVMDIFG
jgi:uncharacterized protein (UPF0335 family)